MRRRLADVPWVAVGKVALGALASASAAGILPATEETIAAIVALYAALSGGREASRNKKG